MSYSNRFLKAMPFVFEHEGGFNEIKGDKGGATNFGVSLNFIKSINEDVNHDGKIDWIDIKTLTKDEATEIYFENFWKPFYDTKLPEKLAIKMFDVAINAGSSRSNKLLQSTVNALGSKVQVDGVLGNQTFSEVLKYTEDNLVKQYIAQQIAFYKKIVENDPNQAKFLKGWTNRANWHI